MYSADLSFRSRDQQPIAPGSREEAPGAVGQDKPTHAAHWYICRHCGQRIAAWDERVVIQGQHLHIFANPSGVLFEIACFSTARGFSFAGNPSSDFAWFSGYTWRIIVCARCVVHLGWMFAAQSSGTFFGLITNRVIPDSSSSG